MSDQQKFNSAIDIMIRLGLLLLLIGGSLMILAAFLIPIIWGVIIAVAIFPMFNRIVKVIKGKKTLAAVFLTIVGLLIIIVPSILLAESTVRGYQYISNALEKESLMFPPPTEDVKTWPVVGEELYGAWDLASKNFTGFFEKYSEYFKNFGSWLLNTMTGLGLTIVQFVISIIIAGVLLAKSQYGAETTFKFTKRLVGDKAEDFVKLVTGTIRSVVQGIVGIALIQAFASAILLLIAGIPFAGLWSLVIMVLAIVQLPPFLVLGPTIIYVFSIYDTVPASIFTVFAVIIGLSDNILKPIFMGRGVDIPMLVILIGAIGGMLVWGILGLFVGAVILALSYKLMIAWLNLEVKAS